MKKNIILSVLFFMSLMAIKAQQLPLFSETYFLRQLYNPALTAYNGSSSIYSFYRDQWTDIPGHPVTAGAVGSMSLWDDRIGTGFHVYSDNTDIIHNVSAQLYYAQKVRLAKDHLLSLGVSFGVMQTYIDFNNAVATDQGDPHLLTSAKGGIGFDMNVGIAYQWKKKLTVSFSVPQVLNTYVPIRTQMTDALYSLNRTFTGGVSYEFSFDKEKFNLEPSFLVRSDFVKPLQWQFDADVMANYKHMFFLGVGYHLYYGVSVMAAVRISQVVTLGYDYDAPIMQNVTYADTKGTQEVVLGLNFDKWLKKKTKKDDFVKQSDFDSLAAATKQIQKNVDTLKQNVDTLKYNTDSLRHDADTLQQQVDSLKHNVSYIKQTSDSVNTREVEEQHHQMAEQQQQMTEQQAQMREMKARIDSFETLVQEYNKTIAKKPIQDFPQNVDKTTTAAKGDVFRLNSVNFETNSSYLTRGSYAELDKVVTFLLNNPNLSVRINGHTDFLASDEYNQWLSDRRAKRVYDYLADKGVATDRMKWIGFGKRSPIADNNTEEGRAKNRRVEVEITKKE